MRSKSATLANIKINSATLIQLKRLTGQKTGQKAVDRALVYFIREAWQRNIIKFLSTKPFREDFNPLELRSIEK